MNMRELYGGLSEVRKASVHRLDDAQAAHNATRWRACMYLAGYAVECRFKAALMRKYGCLNLRDLVGELVGKGVIEGERDIYTHSLERLLNLTDRAGAFRENAEVVKQFSVVNRWIPAWRYTSDLSNADDAELFLASARGVLHWIDVNV